jgi:hypothetical protein
MSEGKDGKPEESKESKIKVTVDRSPEIDSLNAELAKIRKEAEIKTAEAEKLSKEKSDLEALKGNLQTEKEDLEAKLKTIAEKEFNAQRDAVLSRVKTVFKDPADEARVKEIEARLNDPEKGPDNLKQTIYMMGVLEDSIKKANAEKEKEAQAEIERKKASQGGTLPPAPTGGDTAHLTPQQISGAINNPVDAGYDSYEAMIRDLRNRARNGKTPADKAEAEAILKQLWVKWGKQVKKDFESGTSTSRVDYEPEEQKSLRDTQKAGA